MFKSTPKVMKGVLKVGKTNKVRPALTPEGREQQLINLAYNAALEQLQNGTASSQVITHFLKLGSTKNILEAEKIKQEVAMLAAKTEALKTADTVAELYDKAIKAFSSYGGGEI